MLKRLLKLLMIKPPNKITFMEQQFNDKVVRNHLSVSEESSTNIAEFPIFANKFQSLFFLWSFTFAGKDFANERPYVVNVAPVILIQERTSCVITVKIFFVLNRLNIMLQDESLYVLNFALR